MGSDIGAIYWRSYGGFEALFSSPYLRAAIIISLMLYPHWSQPNWWDDVLSIMPNLLGFSLGGFAMWIAIGDDDFRKLISGEITDDEPSPYMEVNAAFVHFVILQMLAILCSLFAKAYYFPLPPDHFILGFFGDSFFTLCLIGNFFGYVIFIYALLSAVAATLALLRVTSWYDIDQTKKIAHKKLLDKNKKQDHPTDEN